MDNPQSLSLPESKPKSEDSHGSSYHPKNKISSQSSVSSINSKTSSKSDSGKENDNILNRE
jgi:hypothetical protein